MGHKLYGISLALLALLVLVSTARSDDKPNAPAAGGDQQAMMDAYTKAAAPGPEHARLAKLAGDWDADVKMFNPDGSAGGNTKGAMHAQMILGGRYLQLNYSGEMDMGGGNKMPFKGVGIGGYDNARKKYTNFWIDEMSTGFMQTEGTYEGNVLTCEGTSTDPMSGQPMKVKEVMTEIDDTHHKYELSMAGQDGKMMKVLEITYTKKS
jgi:hypothetical protein